MNVQQPTTLPIRRWLVLALIVVFALPVIVTGFVAYRFVFDGNGDVNAANDASAYLRENASRWPDPAWQAAARSRLAADGVDFVLFSDGREIFRSTAEPLAGTSTHRVSGPPWWTEQGGRTVHLVEIDGTSPALTAYVFSPQSDVTRPWPLPLVGVSMLLITLGGIGWVIGRMVVRPLAATGRAARLFATGEMDVALPTSRVREIAEVNTAFDAMRAGLRESLQQQAELEQQRRFIIGAVAHDLRTPLFSLRGYLEGLQQGVADTPEKRARYVAVAQEKAEALEHLVSDLFDFTRLEYLDFTPENEPFDLAELVQRLAGAAQPLAMANRVTVNVRTSGDCLVEGDSHLLVRAVENILDNALRHTPEGGEVAVSSEREGSSVRFEISDSGPGIPAEDLPHVFDALYRGDQSRSRKTGGAGLGLAIARRIVVAHGGTLVVANRTTGGAAFVGTLRAA